MKIILNNKDYFYGVNAKFCKGTACYTAPITENGDTLIIKTSLPSSSYKLQLTGELSFRFEPHLLEGLNTITAATEFIYRPSFQMMKTTGKAGDYLQNEPGDYFDIVFNDTQYFPDKMTVKLKASVGEAQATNTLWDVVGSGAEYINAMIGRFEVPAIPTGAYTVVVTDPDGVEYLYETTNVFTVTN